MSCIDHGCILMLAYAWDNVLKKNISCLKIFLSWKPFFLDLATYHAPFTPEVRVVRSFRNYSLFPLGTHHLVELALVVAPGLMARLDPWRFTPSCKHPSVWLHIPRDLPILLSFVLRSGCPLGIIHPSRIRPSEWMSYLIGTVPTILFSPLTWLVITYLSFFICTKKLMQMLMSCHAW